LHKTRKNSPIIDILLLTYNNIDNTKKCIENLYKYTEDFGLVILDNKSTDGTCKYLLDLIKEHDNITLFLGNENLGIIKGRNYIYKISQNVKNKAKYICFLDNDQMVKEGWLDSYLEIIDSGYDIVGKESWKMNNRFYPYKRNPYVESDPVDSFSYVGCGGLVIKNEVIKKIGLFDEQFSPSYFEDPDFCFRANEAGYKVGWNYKPVIDHNHHGPLLNKERRRDFMKSWKKFQKKWGGKEIPVFKM